MPASIGGSAMQVTTATGGRPAEGRFAQPVVVVSGSSPAQGGRARRVVVTTSGPILGGSPIPVYDAGPNALCSGEAPLLIYIVSGTLS